MKLQCLICKSESFIKAGFTKQNKQRYPGGEADFEYDTYGNLVKDRNKKIDKIRYNHLNLPKKITFENNDVIEYLYDANGTKLKKTVTAGTTITETQYLDGFQYEKPAGGGDWGMSFFPTAEGYVNVTHGALSPAYNYVYNYTDHLGNIRLRYTKNPAITGPPLKILEEDHYYPFGLKHNGYNGEHSVFEPGEPGGEPVVIVHVTPLTVDLYKYKFQGQEHQDEFGLNWDSFKYRNYSPDLGRFWVVDPLAEDYVHNSTYAFSENKVIDHIELEGLEGVHTSKINAAGQREHTIRKNIVVLTQSLKPVNEGANPKKVERIKKRNERIEKRNERKIEMVKESLNDTYSNAKNTAGESVTFDFNVIGIVGNDMEQSVRGTKKIAEENGITTSEGKIANAAVIGIGKSGNGTAGTTGGDFFIKLSEFDAIGHEVGHTLLTRENGLDHSKTGLMTPKYNDISKLTPTEVDKIIEDAYKDKGKDED